MMMFGPHRSKFFARIRERFKPFRNENWNYAFQIIVPLFAFFVLITVLATFYKPQLQQFGTSFINRFGWFGICLGVVLADGFHCPISPQFYMWTGMASGRSHWTVMSLVCASSLIAAHIGFFISKRLNKFQFLKRRIERSHAQVDHLLTRFRGWAMPLCALLPIPFSVMCYIAGLYRIRYRYFAFFLLFRIPKLILFYIMIRLGWGN